MRDFIMHFSYIYEQNISVYGFFFLCVGFFFLCVGFFKLDWGKRKKNGKSPGNKPQRNKIIVLFLRLDLLCVWLYRYSWRAQLIVANVKIFISPNSKFPKAHTKCISPLWIWDYFMTIRTMNACVLLLIFSCIVNIGV